MAISSGYHDETQYASGSCHFISRKGFDINIKCNFVSTLASFAASKNTKKVTKIIEHY